MEDRLMKTYLILLLIFISNTIGAKVMRKEIATLAGGCFWGMEEIIRKIPGVTNTIVGYSGGTIDNPNYNIVKLGTTNHAESIQVEFNPSQLPYSELLSYFFRMHDPTTVNQQGNDKGTQYRSVIFYHSNEQKQIAFEMIKKVNDSKKWQRPIVTEVIEATKFYPAEEYHQDYLQKNPNGYTCHWLRN
jgi:peptide-methionine (S)-S-oxide reductase/peptide methionine sulfoxide reductase msrA/msrB